MTMLQSLQTTASDGDNDLDPNIEELRRLAGEYRQACDQARRARARLDLLVVELKERGYSYPVLARETRLAQGTIQNIIAKHS